MTTDLAKRESTFPTLSKEDIELVKNTVAVGLNNIEFNLFIYTSKQLNLNPLLHQIHAVKRKDKMTIQIGIDGFRILSDRTGKLAGIERDVVVDNGKVIGAWAKVYRTDWKEPAYNKVWLEEYIQKNQEGQPMAMWAKMPKAMIMKCAEAGAHRMAFPDVFSGIYSDEEMDQAGNEIPKVLNGNQPEIEETETEIKEDQETKEISFNKHGKVDWTYFWVKVRELGIPDTEVHNIAGVESLKDFSIEQIDKLYSELLSFKNHIEDQRDNPLLNKEENISKQESFDNQNNEQGNDPK